MATLSYKHYADIYADAVADAARTLARQMDRAQLNDYWKRFGLGKPTGIQLPGESGGIIPPADMTDIQRDQAAFGQALSVTTIQEAAAIAGMATS